MGKLVLTAVVLFVLVLSGCRDTPKHWYYFEGKKGYINLSQVKVFSTSGHIMLYNGQNHLYTLNGEEINRGNIDKVLEKVKNYNEVKVLLDGKIFLDKEQIQLPSRLDPEENKKYNFSDTVIFRKCTKKELKEILEKWLDIVNDVKASLP